MNFFTKLFGKQNVPAAAPASQTYHNPFAVKRPSPVSSGFSSAVQGNGNWMAATVENEQSSMVTVYDPMGKPLQLGSRDEKANGGEGVVYTLPANPNFLIKVYKHSTLRDPQKMQEIHQRILDMVRIKALTGTPGLAWPLMPVLDKQSRIVGFAMRKCSGDSLLALRGPANIKKRFPRWDRLNLANIALDYVIKLKTLTAQNVLVNDFNPSNFLVDAQGNVAFIDCDSFQIPSANGQVNVTKTYFASHVAPELLKDKALLARPRNIHHVEFGAALTVFNILMCGLHPYNYYDPSQRSACGTPDENLLKGRCPLGRGAGCRLPQGGWYNLWSYLTGTLKGGFINTFRGEEGHSHPERRMTLDQLEIELRKLIFEMKRDPMRRELMPQTPKPSTDLRKQSDIF